MIRDESGKVTHRQGVIADITLSKIAEQELEKREKLYRTLAEEYPRNERPTCSIRRCDTRSRTASS